MLGQQYRFDVDNRGGDIAHVGANRDITPQSDGSYHPRQLQRFLLDIRFEPTWRQDAELDTAFYDGDQLKTDVVRRMLSLGIPPVVVNFVGPAIDSVAGLEVLTRAALKLEPETDESYEAAVGLNVKFKESQRLTMFNQKVGYQYKEALTSGISWIEIARNPDVFGYRYETRTVPWREMWVDYRAREPDYSDARFMVRAKWFDVDDVVRYFPQHKDVIKMASLAGGGAEGWLDWETFGFENGPRHNRVYSEESDRPWTLEEDEWRQQHRGRIRLYEILYYVPTRAEVLDFHNGTIVQFDRDNRVHLEALRRGMAEHRVGMTKNWRQAFFIGPDRLLDRPCEANLPHYVPMVAFRKSSNGAPYGLVRRMRSAQEAFNARYARMLYDLSSRQYLIDDDAVNDPTQTARELNKVVSMVVLKSDRKGDQGIVMLPATDNSPIVYQMLQEAKQNVYDATGLHPEFQGRTMEAGRSGVAIEQLVEQTTQVLGVVYDNMRNAKRRAGEILFAYQVKDLGRQNDVAVETDPRSDGKKTRIILNGRGAQGPRTNDVLMAKVRIALGTVPDTVTYQEQKFRALTEVIKSIPEQYQAVLADFVVRAANLPEGEEILERIRQVSGFGPEPRDPELREQLRAEQQRKAALEQRMAEIEVALAEAELNTAQAKAALEGAKAEKTEDADSELTDAKTLLTLAQAKLADAQAAVVPDEQSRKDRETRAKAIEGAARLRAAANPPQPAAKKSK